MTGLASVSSGRPGRRPSRRPSEVSTGPGVPDRLETGDSGARFADPRGSGPATQILVLTGRSVRATLLSPLLLVGNMLGPLFMLFIFSQVFNGMSRTPSFPQGIDYHDFLMPAILVNWSLQSAIYAGFGLTQEIQQGIVNRFRSLPIWLGSVLVARSLAETIRTALQLLCFIILASAFFGVPTGGGLMGSLGAWLLAVLVGSGLGWIFIALACWVRTADLLQSVSATMIFPLMFASNAFAPIEDLPAWLRVVARLNPITYAIDAARDLVLGRPAAMATAATALVASTAIGVAAAWLAVRGFRRTP